MKIDSYKVKQYEGQRIVSEIELIEEIPKNAKFALVYVKELSANCLIPVKDISGLKDVQCEYCGHTGPKNEIDECCDEAEAGGFDK